MQAIEPTEATPAKTLVGLWPARIPQDSVDHLARALARRTKAEIVAERFGRYIYVYTFGDLAEALVHFEMISRNFRVR